jgi:hypothetical protein
VSPEKGCRRQVATRVARNSLLQRPPVQRQDAMADSKVAGTSENASGRRNRHRLLGRFSLATGHEAQGPGTSHSPPAHLTTRDAPADCLRADPYDATRAASAATYTRYRDNRARSKRRKRG